MGTAVTMQALPNDSTYRTVLAREFNIVTPDNEMKFQWVHPERVKRSYPVSEAAPPELGNRYDFTGADAIVKFAEENDMQVCVEEGSYAEEKRLWLFRSDEDWDLA